MIEQESMLNISLERLIQWVKDPFLVQLQNFILFTKFIAEDKKALFNSSLGSSNALLVNGVTSGLINIQVTNFV